MCTFVVINTKKVVFRITLDNFNSVKPVCNVKGSFVGSSVFYVETVSTLEKHCTGTILFVWDSTFLK